MKLEKPTKELIEMYRRAFERKHGAEEEAIRELFKIFSDNKDYKGVLLKSVVINSLHGTRIMRIENLARHICEDIDDRLKLGDPHIVDPIAKVTIKGKERRNYSFASKYCSFHQPSLYPIYDSIVDRILRAYQRQDSFFLSHWVT